LRTYFASPVSTSRTSPTRYRLLPLTSRHNAFTTIPPALLLLPALQVLDLSYNTLTSIDISNPVSPTEEGLSYGAGFLSTSFSRAQNRSPLSIWPVLRNLNLSNNRLTNDGLKGLNTSTRLEGMRILHLARNALQLTLNVESIGAGIDDMPGLTSLVLNGNARLRGIEGDIAPEAVVEMDGCGVVGSNKTNTPAQQHQNESQAAAGDTPAPPQVVGNGSGTPLPDMTIVYRTCPAATFDSEPLNIQFDLYLPPKPQPSSKPIPVIVWFHGGGLLQGNKENLSPHFRRLPQHPFPTSNGEEHVAVISPNYRLAPQVPIIDILSDITAIFDFVKTQLNSRLKGEYVIDTERICASGGSAGGYLALIAGLGVPKSAKDEVVGGYRGEGGIKCIAPFYPITDLMDEFWLTETNPVPWYGRT
jgi:acetyl esterase/lipase